jgi:hypothetical protein
VGERAVTNYAKFEAAVLDMLQAIEGAKRVQKSQVILPEYTYRCDRRELAQVAGSLSRQGFTPLSNGVLGQHRSMVRVTYRADTSGGYVEVHGPAAAAAEVDTLLKSLPIGRQLHTPERYEQLRTAYPQAAPVTAQPKPVEKPIQWARSYQLRADDVQAVLGILTRYAYTSRPVGPGESHRVQLGSVIIGIFPAGGQGTRAQLRISAKNPQQALFDLRQAQTENGSRKLMDFLRPV